MFKNWKFCSKEPQVAIISIFAEPFLMIFNISLENWWNWKFFGEFRAVQKTSKDQNLELFIISWNWKSLIAHTFLPRSPDPA